MSKFGYFDDKNKEYIITRPDTPRPWDNFLWNDVYYTYIDQLGKGYSRYQTDEGWATHVIFGAHNQPQDSRLIYLRDDESGEYWNVGWDPVQKKYDKYLCRHGLGYTVIENTTDKIEVEYRIFVPLGNEPLELWTLKVRNLGNNKRNISLFTYTELSLAGYRTYGHLMFMSGHFYPEIKGIIARKRAEGLPHSKYAGFISGDFLPFGFDASRRTFLGTYRRLTNPQVVSEGRCLNSIGTGEPIVGVLQNKFSLKGKEENVFNFIVGVTDVDNPTEEARRLIDRYLDTQKIEEEFKMLKEERNKKFSPISIDSPDEELNRITNIWNKQQVSYGATWVRWGIKGYRDILQHAQGVITFDLDRAKKDILDALCYQYSDGFALRGWAPVDKMKYSDSAQWMVSTITEYIKESGDFGLLEIDVPFYDEGTASVLEHMVRALRKLYEDRGEKGLCLIRYGDWNDSLTSVGKAGKGTSVWLSMALCRSAMLLRELAKRLNRKSIAEEMDKIYREVKDALNRDAWNGGWYVCAFDDNGRAIGSKDCEEGKIFLNMQSWAIMSGIATQERQEKCLASVEKYLDSGYGFLLNTPVYTKYDPHIGRLTNLEPGICENGTVYCHGNAFLMIAYLLANKGDKAYSVYRAILPENPNNPSNTAVPYVFPNGYYGPSHKTSPGRIEYSWITGSCGWIFQAVTEWMFGVRRTYDGLLINPCIPSSWPSCKMVRNYRKAIYDININNPERVETGIKRLKVDGEEVDPVRPITPFADGKNHQIEVIMG
ncbi:hypothetical protein KKC91_11870 [bacterium]|nr:hypothetical protein [bacterium]MBU1852852.1 hypothetical protein [Candidatus Omnitrophota bacterium]